MICIILIMKKKELQQIREYFRGVQSEETHEIIEKLIDSLVNCRFSELWELLNQTLRGRRITHQLRYKLLIKLMDQQAIQALGIISYEFLLKGKKMNNSKRQSLIKDEGRQELKFMFLNLIDLWEREELPQYQLLYNFFIGESKLTLKDILERLTNSVNLSITIGSKIAHKRQLRNSTIEEQQFNLSEVLTEGEIIDIYHMILPITVIELANLKENNFDSQEFQRVRDSEIIVFKGMTGVGKSTLILYLLGYRFQIVKDQYGLLQTVPVNIDQSHREIISKASIDSVTSSIHFVEPKDPTKRIVFADSPGNDDLRGLTRQFFNHFLHRKLNSICERLKFVEVVDVNTLLSSKINGIKKFTGYISSNYIFGDWSQLQERLTVVFTRCSSDYREIKILKEILRASRRQREILTQSQQQVVHFLLVQLSGTIDQTPIIIPQNFHEHPEKGLKLLNFLANKQAHDPKIVTINYLIPQLTQAIASTINYYGSYLNINQLASDRYKIVLHSYNKCKQLSHFTQATDILSQNMELIRQNINAYKEKIELLINNLTSNLKMMMERHYDWEGFQTKAEEVKLQLQRFELYSQSLQQTFTKKIFYKQLVDIIQSNLHHQKLNKQFTFNTQEVELFELVTDKFIKINRMKRSFTELQVDPFLIVCQKYFENEMDIVLSELQITQRFERFIFTIEQETKRYLNTLTFATSIYHILKKCQYLKHFSQKIQEKLNKVILNCQMLIAKDVDYSSQTELRQDASSIHIKSLIALFNFLNELLLIPFFEKETKLRDRIIQKLEKQLVSIKQEMSINQSSVFKNSQAFSKLQYFKKLKFDLKNRQNSTEENQKLYQLQKFLQVTMQEVKAHSSHQQQPLQNVRSNETFNLERDILKSNYAFFRDLFPFFRK